MPLYTNKFLQELAQEALRLNQLFCRSRVLTDSFRAYWLPGDPSSIRVYTPYYWARYYHDGVSFIRTVRKGTYLVWFKDPRDDPRISPYPRGYPKYRRDVRKLKGKDFFKYKKAGKLVWKKEAGPIPSHPWTNQVYREWQRRAPELIRREFARRVSDLLKPLKKVRIKG